MKPAFSTKMTGLTLALVLSAQGTAFAHHAPANTLIKVQPSAIYQVVKDQSLSDTLTDLSQRSGYTFKINVDISKNLVSKTLAAKNWDDAVKSLLVGYNYSLIDNGKIKTVIISGYNGNGTLMQASAIPEGKLKVIKPVAGAIPAKYKNFPEGSVLPVSIPVKKLMTMQDGETATLDLPIGQFELTKDSIEQVPGGTAQTWTGHLTHEGIGYRMMLSQGEAGIMGHIATPEGIFTIEQNGKDTLMVDTSKFKPVGFEGDALSLEDLAAKL